MLFINITVLSLRADSCEEFNNNSFFEKLTWGKEHTKYLDLFYKCLEEDFGKYIWEQDENGSIPLLN